jgi:hypothetical protein
MVARDTLNARATSASLLRVCPPLPLTQARHPRLPPVLDSPTATAPHLQMCRGGEWTPGGRAQMCSQCHRSPAHDHRQRRLFINRLLHGGPDGGPDAVTA